MLNAVICCIVKDEELYIEEWIRYHLKLGFSYIYIYDNNDDKNRLITYLAKSGLFADEKTRNKIILTHFPGKIRQIAAYNNFIKYHSHKHTWVAVLDCDEFIVLKNWEPITVFLSKLCKQGSLVLHWRIFGDSGKKKYSPEPVTERFTMCWNELFRVFKCISVCSHVKCFTNPHFPILKHGYQHDCSGKLLNGPVDDSKTKQKFVNFAYINHYFGKTYEEWLLKKNRGCADNPNKRTDSEFHAHNQNEVEDLSAYHFYKDANVDFTSREPRFPYDPS
jgi:hypothetical protein